MKIFLPLILAVLVFASCQQPGKNSTGSEYMPDMGHSIAYEANVSTYYSFNTWGTKKEYHKYAQPRVPVKGTVSRPMAHGPNSTPYYFANSEEGRANAIANLIDNPYPITDAGLAKGKELYDIYCGICHGAKGDGNGYLVRDDGGVYPVQPANFLLDDHVNSSNGRYYHAIMFGKNLMGAYKDKLSTEERWQVIHYIRSLQAKDKKLEYNQLKNTLNSIDRPAGEVAVVSEEEVYSSDTEVEVHGHDNLHGANHSDDSHTENHGHNDAKH